MPAATGGEHRHPHPAVPGSRTAGAGTADAPRTTVLPYARAGRTETRTGLQGDRPRETTRGALGTGTAETAEGTDAGAGNGRQYHGGSGHHTGTTVRAVMRPTGTNAVLLGRHHRGEQLRANGNGGQQPADNTARQQTHQGEENGQGDVRTPLVDRPPQGRYLHLHGVQLELLRAVAVTTGKPHR